MSKTNYIITIILTVLSLEACKKDKTEFSDPYGDGKPPLGVTLSRDATPAPATGSVGIDFAV